MSSHFHRRDGELFVEQLPARILAERFGTPCYVYSRQALESAFMAWREALGDHPHLICFAVKANSNIAVLNLLARLGAGFDIVSLGELQRVLLAGGDAGKVVFSGVGKLDDEIEQALLLGIHCFNVESETELERISDIASRHNKIANISIRVNPDVDAQTHPYIATGLKENKFGIDINEAPRVYRRAAALPGLKLLGIDCHIGSQLTSTRPFLDALERVLALADTLAAEGIDIEHLDLGGGLGVRYREETPPSPGDYLSAVLERLADKPFKLLFEPGRSIAANAGLFLTRVNLLKETADKHFAVVDGAMNDLIRPALYQAYQHIEAVSPGTSAPARYDVVGPVCETGDFLGKDRELAISPGDLLAVFSSGAYGFVMSSNYNSRGRAAEIMVDGDRAYIVRQRESLADLVRGETLLPED